MLSNISGKNNIFWHHWNFSRVVFLVFALTGLLLSPVNAESNGRPKIGLVLSGGGACGFAHVGTLALIDSLQIPVDYIAGTSMGGIVGALYAIGYRGKEIEKLILGSDWLDIFTDEPSRDLLPYIIKKDQGKYQLEFGIEKSRPVPPSGLIHGQKVSLQFSKLTYAYEGINDFNNLPIPFNCVTVDLISGKEIILSGGSLAKAMRSTMSIPSLFNPVQWDEKLLIDGGLLNNLPADIVKDMGADIVIGVNVGRPKKQRDELRTVLEILEQSITIPAYNKEEVNSQLIDILVNPDLDNLSPADFSRKNADKIIRQGHIAARRNLPKLIELKQSLENNDHKNSADGGSLLDTCYLHGITIAGNTSLPFTYIYDMLGYEPGDVFNRDSLESRVTNMLLTGFYEEIEPEVQIQDDKYVHLVLRVKDRIKPIIHGVSITGNEYLSFGFIYQLLNIKPLDVFDIEVVEERITELYALGYFETINYVIQPVSRDSIGLVIQINEKPHSMFKVGLRYDDNVNLVGLIGIYGSSALLPGLRLESTLQFAGLTNFCTKLFYPSQTLDLSIYPFARVNFIDEPIHIYDHDRRIATYHNRSTTWAGGVGVMPTRNWNTEVEFAREIVDIEPIVGMEIMPVWKDNLNSIRINTRLDRLDNSILPRYGELFSASFEEANRTLKSDIEYQRQEYILDIYRSINKYNTIRLKAQYARYDSRDTLNYKWAYFGGPNSFVGIKWNQFGYLHTSYIRFDYRYQQNNSIFYKLIVNYAPNWDGNFYPLERDDFWGFGFGIEIMTLFGPMEIIYSKGDKFTSRDDNKLQTNIYFQIGTKF